MRRFRRGDAIDVEAAKKYLRLFIGPPLYAFYRQLTVSNNGLLTRGYHDSHPPMHRCLPLWLSLKHIICVCLRLMKSKKIRRYNQLLQAGKRVVARFDCGGRGNRQCYNFGGREPEIATTLQYYEICLQMKQIRN